MYETVSICTYLSVDDVDALGERLREFDLPLLRASHDTAWGTRELAFNDEQDHTIYGGKIIVLAE